MSSVFGPAVLGSDVEAAAQATLALWMPSYLADLERNTGRDAGVLQPPKSWTTFPNFDQLQGAQLPAGVIVSPGITGEPYRMSGGLYRVTWRIEVAILVTAATQENANDLAKLYARAATMIMLQKPSLGGVASQTEWVAEDYTNAPSSFAPVGAVGGTAFDVTVDNVVTSTGGPAAPTLEPDLYTNVETATIAVERNLT